MVNDDISRRAVVARPRRPPVTPGPAIPVAEGTMQRRSLLPLLAAATLILGGCDFGGDEDDDDEDGDD